VFTGLSGGERERWEREIQQKSKERKEIREVYYRVAAVSCISSFIGGSAAAWLFYYIQTRSE